MTDSLMQLLTEAGFLKPAIDEYHNAEQKITILPKWQCLMSVSPADVGDREKKLMQDIAAESGISEYLVGMLHMLLHIEDLSSECVKRGLVLRELAYDMWTKAQETRELFDCYGMHCYDFIAQFFDFRRVSLGRLEFERRIYQGRSLTLKEYSINTGDEVIGLHIPGGRPLNKADCIESLERAFHYFGCSAEKPLIVHCITWLLNPDHCTMLQQPSNLLDFMGLFSIVGTITPDGFPDAWRIYGKQAYEPIASWPEKNRLQTGYKQLLLKGHSALRGEGFIIFDGIKVLTQK